MKARVINSDESVIYNGKVYSFNDEFEIDNTIGKALIERGLIAGITDDKDLFKDEEIIDGVEVREDIDEMSYQELKSYASKLGISASGKRDELIDRIKSYLDDLDEAEETDELPNTSMPE